MRYAAKVEYNGQAYCGWQRLNHAVAVQNVVEKALSKVANHTIDVTCAGRTDSGVHALSQIIHFDSDAERSERAWLLGSNTNLPDDVALHWVLPVDDSFHARFSAVSRRYRYVILNRLARPALLEGRVYWFYNKLDEQAMHTAAQALIGEQDFSSFRAAGCQAKHAMRNVSQVNVSRDGDYVYIDIWANAFLYHMVRNIVGSLIEVGLNNQSTDWIADLLTLKDRNQAGVTAPAAGLYFVEVFYPDEYALDTHASPPHYAF